MRYLIQALREIQANQAEHHDAYGWMLERKTAGTNGLVYRATSHHPQQLPLALKISKHDDRKRTMREFGAMQALWAMKGFQDLSPQALLFFEQPAGLPGDVLISEWLPGDALQEAPPATDKQLWQAILWTFAQVHNLSPERHRVHLLPSVMHVRHPVQFLEELHRRRNQITQEGQIGITSTAELDAILRRAERAIPLRWNKEPRLSLTFCDPNPQNMIYYKDRIKLVDWANSGWSDPAMDIADMLAQPAYLHLPASHTEWVKQVYVMMTDDRDAPIRVHLYQSLFMIFWLLQMSAGILQSPQDRIPGTQGYTPEHFAQYQHAYYKRVRVLFG